MSPTLVQMYDDNWFGEFREFLSSARWFDNDYQHWHGHEWNKSANHNTSEQNIQSFLKYLFALFSRLKYGFCFLLLIFALFFHSRRLNPFQSIDAYNHASSGNV